MALFTEQILIERANREIQARSYGQAYESLETKSKNILKEWINEQRISAQATKIYDIFLSHSSNDARIVAGLKLEIEDLGYSVYVDWIEDPLLNRASVTKATAVLLQMRMKQCKSLIYAFSENAANSKWMPWELGYFDGIKGTVAVLPIIKENGRQSFKGTEYLGLYYYIQIDTIRGTNKAAIWVHESSNSYIPFNSWLTGSKPFPRT